MEKPDWADLDRLAPGGAETVAAAREAANRLIAECDNGAGGVGFAMRGMVMAIADAFEAQHLERGRDSTLRAVRNAFAERALRVLPD